VSPFEKPEEVGSRPEPGVLDPKWLYIGFSGQDAAYYFDLWRSDGLDTLNFTDPRMDPQPYELECGSLDLPLTKQRMTELRDLFTYLLDNWGRPWARQSHPEGE
jgi:hypothetical protein